MKGMLRTYLTIVAASMLLVGQATPAREDLISHFVREGALAQIPGKKIYRMELDVTGDGVPELFLSSEESKGVGGQEWCVYSPRPDTNSYHYLGRIVFHVYGFRYEEETGEFFVWMRYSGSEGNVVSYRTDASGIHGIRSSPRLVYGSPEHEQEWEKFTKWRQETTIEIMYTEFASLFRKGSVSWRYLSDKPVAHDVSDLKQAALAPEI